MEYLKNFESGVNYLYNITSGDKLYRAGMNYETKEKVSVMREMHFMHNF